MNIKQKAVRGVAWLIAQRSGNQVVSFVVILVLSRLLHPESFGLIAMATVYIALINLFIDQGFLQVIVQKREISKTHLNTAFWTTLMSGGVLTAASFAASGLVASLFHEPMLSPIVRWLSLSLLFSTLSKTPRAILQRDLEFGKLAARTFFAEIFGGAVGIFMAFRGYGVWSLVGRNLSRDFLAMVILWGISDWRPGFTFSPVRLKELLSFGVNIVGSQFLTYISRYADRFLIGILLDAEVLGFYTIGARFIELMSALFLQSVEIVSFPILSMLQNDMRRMRRSFYQLTWYTSVFVLPCFLGILLVAPEIVNSFFGSKWSESIPVLRILALSGVAQVVHFLGRALLIASGKPSWHLALTALNTMTNMLAVALAAQWGIVAVSAGIVMSAYFVIPFTVWAIRRAAGVGIQEYLRQFHPAFAGALAMSVLVFFLQMALQGSISDILGLVVYSVSGLVLYGLLIWRLQPSVFDRIRGVVRLVVEGTSTPTSASSS